MGRPGLTKHRKFIRLERLLGSHLVARGALETLWDAAYENGDEFLGDSLDVEGLARWDGEPGKLTEALLSAGFIDPSDDHSGSYRVHDLWHHAPDYVRKRRKREDERQSKTSPIPSTDRSLTARCHPSPDSQAEVDRTPSPSPSPSPSPLKEITPTPFAALQEQGTVVVVKPEKSKKEKPGPSWQQAIPQEVLDVIDELREIWPDPKRGHIQPDNKSPVPIISWPQAADRLATIQAEKADLTICLAIGRRAVEEFRLGKWIKAPQYFFGKTDDAPWRAMYRAELTNRKRMEAANAE